jgi:hypothetical protein
MPITFTQGHPGLPPPRNRPACQHPRPDRLTDAFGSGGKCHHGVAGGNRRPRVRLTACPPAIVTLTPTPPGWPRPRCCPGPRSVRLHPMPWESNNRSGSGLAPLVPTCTRAPSVPEAVGERQPSPLTGPQGVLLVRSGSPGEPVRYLTPRERGYAPQPEHEELPLGECHEPPAERELVRGPSVEADRLVVGPYRESERQQAALLEACRPADRRSWVGRTRQDFNPLQQAVGKSPTVTSATRQAPVVEPPWPCASSQPPSWRPQPSPDSFRVQASG